MAGDKLPTLQTLEKPEKLQDLLKADRGDDCMPCKVVGMSHRAGPRSAGRGKSCRGPS